MLNTLTKPQVKYNIVADDGEASSVTAFIGAESMVATSDHPSFKDIIAKLEGGESDPDIVRGLFDVGVGIVTKFNSLSDRVSVANGKLFLDGDVMDGALAQAILRFHAAGTGDFAPLVAFLEKIAANPNEHSREHLFRWLRDKHIGICPDGDFIAYKGLQRTEESSTSGTAYVNGVKVTGRIPNKVDTVITMPRSEVTFDPRNGCSTGLHAGNWRYARNFAVIVSIVKINPRDVVSVPVDSSDEKLRVCRYKVIKADVAAEDTSVLFVPDIERLAKVSVVPTPEPEKAAEPKPPRKRPASKKRASIQAKAKPKAVKPAETAIKYPKYYEEFKLVHWQGCPMSELDFVIREWDISPRPRTRDAKEAALTQTAAQRRKTWK
jgi:hypothetical protein